MQEAKPLNRIYKVLSWVIKTQYCYSTIGKKLLSESGQEIQNFLKSKTQQIVDMNLTMHPIL